MKGNPEVIDMLNKALRGELTSINLYFVQSKACRNWGYHKLAQKQYKESIEEMRHAEDAIERILYLGGSPVAQADRIHLGANVKDLLEADLKLESKAVETYNEGIKVCMQVGDAGSREVLEHILLQTEHHVEWLESQLRVIQEVGLDNYLADQIGEEKE
jgi:bacterioferritin